MACKGTAFKNPDGSIALVVFNLLEEDKTMSLIQDLQRCHNMLQLVTK
ncbi:MULTISPECIES: glycoside hydrolase family 30 beta sandwich domain-containing protein [unclassified Lentimonas]|nr:Unannotated [Lentimonas sp. CC19]CAA6693511.1 Unannotated [Lentimonas sp. CC10]CAA7070814.1 Unannotated [Lentimonas sp. CC11]